jgi:type III restriction enzyme
VSAGNSAGRSALPTVDNPIINSAFAEPERHWVIRKGATPENKAGRRTASYYYRVPEGASRGKARKEQTRELFESDKPGEEVELQVANQIRERLQSWRKRNYEGASAISRELLALWQSEDRRQRLFFAQREAAEAIIFLIEGPPDLLRNLNEMIPKDEPGPASRDKGYRAFLRYALKMATGTGKTTVMAMLAAWSILNRLHRPDDERFSDSVLVICPNVTIRDRLRELDPLQGEQSLYATREIVPRHLLPELRRGDVIVSNWHYLALQELKDVNGVSAKVVKRGVPVTKTVVQTIDGQKIEVQETQYLESDRRFVDRVLGKRRGRSPTLLVFNDEAHHAYRRGNGGQEVVLDRELAERNDREATVWTEGLDRINKVLGGRSGRNGIRLCVDLSATPFYIQGSGNEVGKPFPWIVSDFGLLDAIEAGMVKIPMLPSADVTGDERPAYFNIWHWVQEQLEKEGITGEPSAHDMLRFATQPINLLAKGWQETATRWANDYAEQRRLSPAPPVFIVVCRDTSLAREVFEWLANGKADYGAAPAEFRNQPGMLVTVRIDSRVAEEIESGSGSDEARRLRFVLETVGKTSWPDGKVPDDYAAIVARNNAKAANDDSSAVFIDPTIPPGRDVRCIISVAMLSEGWDTTTVTHIVGLRPFGSQLLYMFRVHFEPKAGGWRATHAEINMDPAFFNGSLEDARSSLLAELNYYATPEAHEPQEDGLVTALKLAMQPNYLGAPATVREALHPFFSSVVNHKLGSYIQDLAKVSYQDTIDLNLRTTRIFSGEEPTYTTRPTWHTTAELGKAVVRYFDLDPDD